MSQSNIIGLIAFIAGCVLVAMAWQASQAPVDQMTEALTGRFSAGTMWYLLAGFLGLIVGGVLLLRGILRV